MYKVVVATIATLTTISTVQAKQLHEWWHETRLTLKHFERLGYGKNANCYEDASTFRGCVAIINAAGKSSEKSGFKILPTSLLGRHGFEGGPVQKTFGAFTVISYSMKGAPAAISARENFKREMEKQKILTAEYEKIRTAQPSPEEITPTDLKKWRPTSFEAITAFMLAKTNREPAKESLLVADMINAYYAETIDAHTYLIPIHRFRDQTANGDEKFYGIGCELEVNKSQLTVVRPLPQLPCALAGIQTGDVITHIDDESTEDLSLSDAISKIKGDKPDEVHLTVVRGRVQLLVFKVTRSMITLENVTAQMFKVDQMNVGYIKIGGFEDEDACNKVKEAVNNLQQRKAKAYVLDLRENLGGLVKVGACVAGIFIGPKPILVQRHPRTGKELQITASLQAQLIPANIPVAILVNGLSASASEFVAGSLQEYKRAWIVGERTFGKGTVQTLSRWSTYESDQDAREIVTELSNSIYKAQTTARFHLLPSNRTNQLYGITPDFEVPFKVNATEDERFVQREAEKTQKVYSAVGNPWVQTRPKACKIAACLAAANVGQKVPGIKTGMNDMMNDYQFRSAAEVLRCSMVVDTLPKCAN